MECARDKKSSVSRNGGSELPSFRDDIEAAAPSIVDVKLGLCFQAISLLSELVSDISAKGSHAKPTYESISMFDGLIQYRPGMMGSRLNVTLMRTS